MSWWIFSSKNFNANIRRIFRKTNDHYVVYAPHAKRRNELCRPPHRRRWNLTRCMRVSISFPVSVVRVLKNWRIIWWNEPWKRSKKPCVTRNSVKGISMKSCWWEEPLVFPRFKRFWRTISMVRNFARVSIQTNVWRTARPFKPRFYRVIPPKVRNWMNCCCWMSHHWAWDSKPRVVVWPNSFLATQPFRWKRHKPSAHILTIKPEFPFKYLKEKENLQNTTINWANFNWKEFHQRHEARHKSKSLSIWMRTGSWRSVQWKKVPGK